MVIGLAHEAIRAMLSAVETEAMAVTPQTLPTLAKQVAQLGDCIGLHAEQEDEQMYPPFEAKRKGLTQFAIEEHVQVHGKQHTTEEAMAVAMADASKLTEARREVLAWVEVNRQHPQSEERVLMPWIPRLFTLDEAEAVVRNILTIRPEEYETFHLGLIFSHLPPWQQYTYASILYKSCSPVQFERYERVMQEFSGSKAWNDFKEEERGTAKLSLAV